jgi:hypothetical protein
MKEGLEEVDVLRGVWLHQLWYQSKFISLFFIAERRRFTISPRRERQSPDLEDREVRRRGRPVGNPEMERHMHDL